MENAIRPTAIGKKNVYASLDCRPSSSVRFFVGYPEAGERAAIINSVLISCQRLEVAPSAYLRSALKQDTSMLSSEELSALTPKNWKKANVVEG